LKKDSHGLTARMTVVLMSSQTNHNPDSWEGEKLLGLNSVSSYGLLRKEGTECKQTSIIINHT